MIRHRTLEFWTKSLAAKSGCHSIRPYDSEDRACSSEAYSEVDRALQEIAHCSWFDPLEWP